MASVRQLRAFQAVMLSGTQTLAAKRLRLTQPAVSGLIDSLEEELGFRLFDRVKGRLIPTREASYYFEHAAGVLESLTNLDHVAREIRESSIGNLRIAAHPSISSSLIPHVVAKFRKMHPNVAITLSTFPSPKVVDMLNMQQYDVGVAEAPGAYEHIEVERFKVRGICMVPSGHPLATREILRPEDLDQVPFIRVHREHATSIRLSELWAAANIRPRLDIETQLFWTACMLGREAGALTLVDPFTAIEFTDRGLNAIPFEPPVYVELGIIFPTSRPRSLPAMHFAQYLREYVGKVLQESRASMKNDPGPLLEPGG